jgi:hypothetical protein
VYPWLNRLWVRAVFVSDRCWNLQNPITRQLVLNMDGLRASSTQNQKGQQTDVKSTNAALTGSVIADVKSTNAALTGSVIGVNAHQAIHVPIDDIFLKNPESRNLFSVKSTPKGNNDHQILMSTESVLSLFDPNVSRSNRVKAGLSCPFSNADVTEQANRYEGKSIPELLGEIFEDRTSQTLSIPALPSASAVFGDPIAASHAPGRAALARTSSPDPFQDCLEPQDRQSLSRLAETSQPPAPRAANYTPRYGESLPAPRSSRRSSSGQISSSQNSRPNGCLSKQPTMASRAATPVPSCSSAPAALIRPIHPGFETPAGSAGCLSGDHAGTGGRSGAGAGLRAGLPRPRELFPPTTPQTKAGPLSPHTSPPPPPPTAKKAGAMALAAARNAAGAAGASRAWPFALPPPLFAVAATVAAASAACAAGAGRFSFSFAWAGVGAPAAHAGTAGGGALSRTHGPPAAPHLLHLASASHSAPGWSGEEAGMVLLGVAASLDNLAVGAGYGPTRTHTRARARIRTHTRTHAHSSGIL